MARCSAVINCSTGFSHVLIIGSGEPVASVSHPGFFPSFTPRPMASAGPAGLVCAETLRQEGFTDRIVMCTMDRHPPYDRPKLSKVGTRSASRQQFIRDCRFHQLHPVGLCCGALTCRHQSLESTAEQLQLRSAEFLRDHDIELITEKEVSRSFPPPACKTMLDYRGSMPLL